MSKNQEAIAALSKVAAEARAKSAAILNALKVAQAYSKTPDGASISATIEKTAPILIELAGKIGRTASAAQSVRDALQYGWEPDHCLPSVLDNAGSPVLLDDAISSGSLKDMALDKGLIIITPSPPSDSLMSRLEGAAVFAKMGSGGALLFHADSVNNPRYTAEELKTRESGCAIVEAQAKAAGLTVSAWRGSDNAEWKSCTISNPISLASTVVGVSTGGVMNIDGKSHSPKGELNTSPEAIDASLRARFLGNQHTVAILARIVNVAVKVPDGIGVAATARALHDYLKSLGERNAPKITDISIFDHNGKRTSAESIIREKALGVTMDPWKGLAVTLDKSTPPSVVAALAQSGAEVRLEKPPTPGLGAYLDGVKSVNTPEPQASTQPKGRDQPRRDSRDDFSPGSFSA